MVDFEKNGRIFEVPITYTEREMGDSKIPGGKLGARRRPSTVCFSSVFSKTLRPNRSVSV